MIYYWNDIQVKLKFSAIIIICPLGRSIKTKSVKPMLMFCGFMIPTIRYMGIVYFTTISVRQRRTKPPSIQDGIITCGNINMPTRCPRRRRPARPSKKPANCGFLGKSARGLANNNGDHLHFPERIERCGFAFVAIVVGDCLVWIAAGFKECHFKGLFCFFAFFR